MRFAAAWDGLELTLHCPVNPALEAAPVVVASLDMAFQAPKRSTSLEEPLTHATSPEQNHSDVPVEDPAAAASLEPTGSTASEQPSADSASPVHEGGAAVVAGPTVAASPEATRHGSSDTLSDGPSPPHTRGLWAAGDVQWDGHQCSVTGTKPARGAGASQVCQVLGCNNSLLLLKNYFRWVAPHGGVRKLRLNGVLRGNVAEGMLPGWHICTHVASYLPM